MRTISIFAALMLCLSAAALWAAEGAKSSAKSDKDLIQGTWRVVAMVRNGDATAEEDLKDQPMSMRFAGEVATLSKGDRSKDAGFAIDESKSPKQIVLTPRDGPEKDKPRTNIYELKGDKLKMAFRIGDEPGDAPADFNQGDGVGMMTLERQTP